MSILKDLNELLEAKVISAETASQIQEYYKKNNTKTPSRLLAVFGVLGALLIALGIILIIAHNWDNLSKTIKVVLSFIPLLIGQTACFYTLYKKEDSNAWREASSIFLFFSIAACISLISQIYHIPGNLASFVFTWMLLALPIIYIMKSGTTALMYIIGFTYFAANTGYFTYPNEMRTHNYWLFLLSIIPFYIFFLKNKQNSNFLLFLNWFLAISISICLGIVSKSGEELMFIAYLLLFSLFYFIGQIKAFKNQSLGKNAWLIMGSLGLMGLLLAASFTEFWEEMAYIELAQIEIIPVIILLAANLFFLGRKIIKTSYKNISPFDVIFLVFLLLFLLIDFPSVAGLLGNLFVLTIGVYAIWKGSQTESLAKLNAGLLIIGVLIACRFFDTELNFVLKGSLFVLVGCGFFVTNYLMLKKMKKDEK